MCGSRATPQVPTSRVSDKPRACAWIVPKLFTPMKKSTQFFHFSHRSPASHSFLHLNLASGRGGQRLLGEPLARFVLPPRGSDLEATDSAWRVSQKRRTVIMHPARVLSSIKLHPKAARRAPTQALRVHTHVLVVPRAPCGQSGPPKAPGPLALWVVCRGFPTGSDYFSWLPGMI